MPSVVPLSDKAASIDITGVISLTSIPGNPMDIVRKSPWHGLLRTMRNRLDISCLRRGTAPSFMAGVAEDASPTERAMIAITLARALRLSEASALPIMLVWTLTLAFVSLSVALGGYGIMCHNQFLLLISLGGLFIAGLAQSKILNTSIKQVTWVDKFRYVVTNMHRPSLSPALDEIRQSLCTVFPTSVSHMECDLAVLRACGIKDTVAMVRLVSILQNGLVSRGDKLVVTLDGEVGEMIGRVGDSIKAHMQAGIDIKNRKNMEQEHLDEKKRQAIHISSSAILKDG